MWFGDEPVSENGDTRHSGEMQGNVSLIDCMVMKEDFSFSIRLGNGKAYSFLLPTVGRRSWPREEGAHVICAETGRGVVGGVPHRGH